MQDQSRERPVNPALQRGSESGGCRVHQESGVEIGEGLSTGQSPQLFGSVPFLNFITSVFLLPATGHSG